MGTTGISNTRRGSDSHQIQIRSASTLRGRGEVYLREFRSVLSEIFKGKAVWHWQSPNPSHWVQRKVNRNECRLLGQTASWLLCGLRHSSFEELLSSCTTGLRQDKPTNIIRALWRYLDQRNIDSEHLLNVAHDDDFPAIVDTSQMRNSNGQLMNRLCRDRLILHSSWWYNLLLSPLCLLHRAKTKPPFNRAWNSRNSIHAFFVTSTLIILGINTTAILQMVSRTNLINYHWWCLETALDEKFNQASQRCVSIEWFALLCIMKSMKIISSRDRLDGNSYF